MAPTIRAALAPLPARDSVAGWLKEAHEYRESGVTFAGIGPLFWLLWAWVSGSAFSALGATSEEWAEMQKTVWTATLLATPAGTLALWRGEHLQRQDLRRRNLNLG